MFLLKTWRTSAFGVYGYPNFTKSGFVEHAKNFNQEDMQVRMEGKNCVVTGANSGIGYATAEGFTSRFKCFPVRGGGGGVAGEDGRWRSDGTRVVADFFGGSNEGGRKKGEEKMAVYMICRNKERGEAALSKIQSVTGNKNVHLEVCDVSSVSEIKSFVSRLSVKNEPVHVLVNNAGIIEKNRVTTSEGYEMSFAVNVLSSYTMTEASLPLLEKASPDAKVITVASGGMYTAPLTEDLQYSGSKFDGVDQYARNKRVQVALTEKWAEIYKDKAIGFYSMHPRWAETPGVEKSLPDFSKALSGKLRSSQEGADTIIWLALQPKEKLKSGEFYFDRGVAPKHLLFTTTRGSHSAIDSIVQNIRSMDTLSS